MTRLQTWGIIVTLMVAVTSLWAEPVLLGTAMDSAAQSAGIADSGMQLVRIRADWPTIQPAKTTWNYAQLDAAVTAARAKGLAVVLVLGPTPVWAVDNIPNPTQEEARRAKPNVAAYKAFATAVATRYADRVQYIQAWDTPAVCPMLAVPRDVYVMYAEATRAIHKAAPQMKVIVPEAGDVNLSWIAGYTKSVQGPSCADAILLIPSRTMTTVEAFWPRMDVLRTRILPGVDAPALWLNIPVQTGMAHNALQLAAGGLLQNIDTVVFESATPNGFVISDPQFASGVAALARVQGRNYAGWASVGRGMIAGIYPGKASSMALIVPLAPGTATVSGKSIQVYWPTSTTPAAASGSATLEVSNAPVVVDGVEIANITAGSPALRPEPVNAPLVHLDASGQNPAAIHPLPQLPGGQYRTSQFDGKPVLSTVRNTAPWIHVDVPDGFLFYNTDLRPLEVAVTVIGAQRPKKAGFYLYYDAHGSMASTPWQWIDVGPNQTFTYTVKLTDAIFANREGYDFRICMGGSDEEIKVVDISVKKL